MLMKKGSWLPLFYIPSPDRTIVMTLGEMRRLVLKMTHPSEI